MKKLLVNLARFLFTLILFEAFIAQHSLAQTKAQKIEELMHKCYENDQFNGSVLIAEKGKIIYNKAFGLANIQSQNQVLPITAFNLASVSKQFTAMAVMILQERGKLRYEDDSPRKEIRLAIDDILRDRPHHLPKISIGQTLGKIIIQQGVNAAIKQYHELKNKQTERYNFDEGELNNLGYALLELKKSREAIAIFTLNVAAFPQSFKAYDSLGEAYMSNGEKEPAIKTIKSHSS